MSPSYWQPLWTGLRDIAGSERNIRVRVRYGAAQYYYCSYYFWTVLLI